MTVPSLYKITEELTRLDELLETSPDENLLDYFKQEKDAVVELLTSKVDACVEYVRREEDLIELAKQRIKELQAYVKAKENKLGKFEDYVYYCMQTVGKERFEGQLAEIKKRRPVQAVDIYDESQIPSIYVTAEVITKIDRKTLLTDLKSGIEVPGAQLKEGKTSITFGLKRGKHDKSNNDTGPVIAGN
jgi:hypothetical protein